MSSPKQRLIQHIEQKHPSLVIENLNERISDLMISPYCLELPHVLRSQISQFVAAYHQHTHAPDYQALIASKYPAGLGYGKNFGVMMSYDFHWNREQGLKLIEVNTNASFQFIGSYIIEALKDSQLEDPLTSQIVADFQNELELGSSTKKLSHIAIVDKDPAQQKLYAEFLLAKAHFNDLGLHCEIKDSNEASSQFDFIYNRDTDFYFQSADSKALLDIYLKQATTISPHPFEYFLSADKSNSTDLQKIFKAPEFLESQTITPENSEEIWAQRKKYFFKPAQSFGSKSSFKGASISKRMFDEIKLQQTMLAQEFCPPTESIAPDTGTSFKWDIRCYAYGPQYKFSLARLYQGQVTNARTEGGGFATVKFTLGESEEARIKKIT